MVWFAAGLVFPLLAVTGTMMWWNRFVRPRRLSTVLTPRDQADSRQTAEERVAGSR